MVIIRNPDDAVASLVQLTRGASVSRGFRAFAQFYRACSDSLPGALLVDFTEVTSSMPSVMEKMYKRFDLDWPAYAGTAEDEKAVMDAIDGFSRKRRGGVIHEAGVARPSPHRRPADEILAGLTNQEQKARETAQQVYRELSSTRTSQT